MSYRTIEEINEDLASVRKAIRNAEEAQEYASGLGNSKVNPNLKVLYDREERLMLERNSLTGGAPIVVTHGVVRR